MSHLNNIFEVDMHFTCIKMICELSAKSDQAGDFQWDLSRAALYVSVFNHNLRIFRKYFGESSNKYLANNFSLITSLYLA